MNKYDKILKIYENSILKINEMDFLSNKIKDKDFKNVDIVKKPSKYAMMGQDPKVLYLNLEPYNKEITDKYMNTLLKKIQKKKSEILKAFPGKEIIIVNDRFIVDKYIQDKQPRMSSGPEIKKQKSMKNF